MKKMPLSEIVKALRNARGWSYGELARAVAAQGGPHAKPVKSQHIQNLEKKGHTPRYLPDLAAALGKSVDDLLNWRPGMPIDGPNEPRASVNPEKLTPALLLNRYEHDVDQLRLTVWNLIDVLTARTQGAAGELLDRLMTTAEAFPDPEYGDKGFHARVIGSLRTIAQSEEAADIAAPQRAAPGSSKQRRAT